MAAVAVKVRPCCIHGRLRALQRELHRVIGDRVDFLPEFRDFRLGRVAGLQHMRGEARDVVRSRRGQLCLGRVTIFDFADCRGNGIPGFMRLDLDGRSIGPRVGHRMPAVSVRLAFDELRAAAAADVLESATRRFAHLHHVHPIDLFGGNVVGSGALVDLRHGRMPVDFGADRIVIVFAHKEYRQAPKCRHVQRLMERALVDRAVAEETDDCFGTPAHGHGICNPDRDGATLAHDRVSTHEAPFGVEHVHGPPHAAARSIRAAEQLGHDVARRSASHDCVRVLAIGADDVIGRSGRVDDPRTDRLLAGV